MPDRTSVLASNSLAVIFFRHLLISRDYATRRSAGQDSLLTNRLITPICPLYDRRPGTLVLVTNPTTMASLSLLLILPLNIFATCLVSPTPLLAGLPATTRAPFSGCDGVAAAAEAASSHGWRSGGPGGGWLEAIPRMSGTCVLIWTRAAAGERTAASALPPACFCVWQVPGAGYNNVHMVYRRRAHLGVNIK